MAVVTVLFSLLRIQCNHSVIRDEGGTKIACNRWLCSAVNTVCNPRYYYYKYYYYRKTHVTVLSKSICNIQFSMNSMNSTSNSCFCRFSSTYELLTFMMIQVFFLSISFTLLICYIVLNFVRLYSTSIWVKRKPIDLWTGGVLWAKTDQTCKRHLFKWKSACFGIFRGLTRLLLQTFGWRIWTIFFCVFFFCFAFEFGSHLPGTDCGVELVIYRNIHISQAYNFFPIRNGWHASGEKRSWNTTLNSIHLCKWINIPP